MGCYVKWKFKAPCSKSVKCVKIATAEHSDKDKALLSGMSHAHESFPDSITQPSEYPNLKLKRPKTGQDVEQLELSHINAGNLK